MHSDDRIQTMIEVDRAIDFLNHHPALHRGGGGFFDNNFAFWISHVCSHGHHKEASERPEDKEVKIRQDDPRFEKFFDKYKDEGDDLDDPDCYILVPYREVYGCEWTHHRSLYVGEYMIVKWDGTDTDDILGYRDWSNYHGGREKAETFEDLLLKIEMDVKMNYGCCNGLNSLTKEELENHAKESRFIPNPSCEDDLPFHSMKLNPNYIDVSEGEINLRWWKWYETTEHYKNNWEGLRT